jgi:hypothetical protein
MVVEITDVLEETADEDRSKRGQFRYLKIEEGGYSILNALSFILHPLSSVLAKKVIMF